MVRNPVVADGLDFYRIFTTNAWGSPPEYSHTVNYRPLSVLSIAVTHELFGLDPAPYRATNICLHGVVSLLLFLFLRKLSVPLMLATVASLWFALHPIHTETVLFVVNREEMLCAIFFLLALMVATERSALLPKEKRKFWSIWSFSALAILTALAVFSKEQGAMIPVAVLLIGLLWPGPDGRLKGALLPGALSGIFVALYFVLRLQALGFLGVKVIPWQDNPIALIPIPDRWAYAAGVAFEACRLLLFPLNLTVDYGYNALEVAELVSIPRILAMLFIFALLLVAIVFASNPLLRLGGLVIVISCAPVSHFFFPATVILAERLLFLPSFGAAMVFAWIGTIIYCKYSRYKYIALTLVFVPFLAAFPFLTTDRIAEYRDAETLYSTSLRNRPGSTRLHNNLGLALLNKGEVERAEKHFRISLAIDPQNAEAHNNLALLLAGTGRPVEAVAEFQAALSIRPNMRSATHNLCLLLVRLKKDSLARPICERAKELGVPVADYESKSEN